VASRASDGIPQRLLLVKGTLLSSTSLALAGPSLVLDRTGILTYVGCTPCRSMLVKEGGALDRATCMIAHVSALRSIPTTCSKRAEGRQENESAFEPDPSISESLKVRVSQGMKQFTLALSLCFPQVLVSFLQPTTRR
jgi:hypothetical protein